MAQDRSIMELLAPGAMNGVLNANDLRAVGLQPMAEQPQLNSYEKNVYAIWTTQGSEGRGDVELDLSDVGSQNPTAVLQSALGEAGGEPQPVQLAGAEEAYLTVSEEFAGVGARRGALVICLDIPATPQVYQLASLVLQRLAA